MSRLADAGCEVRYVAFSIATRSLPEGFPPDTLAREVLEATGELGIPEALLTVHDFDVRTFPEHRQDILEALVALWEEWQPDVVFQPSLHDVHQDHKTIAEEGLRAFKRTTILGYEIPWNNFDFSYQWYVALEKRHIERMWILYTGNALLERHGLVADAIQPWLPAPGWYVLSETGLALNEDARRGAYRWLDDYKMRRVGKSMRLYHVPGP